ncbi:hypothetical protein EBB79_08280 [Parasedimentitalea marina]|uniref:Uncharacterized protein n=1 Tax=Parasedimentitalea marina TaxID=2483033 RepID=A0A3T0N1J3_9RHOB|nr:hypothetical protein [Parasedimentitalea marina]AZV77893.1 hypothetical protein EBB79_08280 [Parasedimentitalea marina]
MGKVAMIKIAAVPAAGFHRCGKFFPKSGVIVDPKSFSEEQLERLKDEPMLRVTPASDDDESRAEARAEQIAEGIRSLAAADYQKDGKPKVDALNDLLGDDLGKITASERNGIWDHMLAEDFKAPEPDA